MFLLWMIRKPFFYFSFVFLLVDFFTLIVLLCLLANIPLIGPDFPTQW